MVQTYFNFIISYTVLNKASLNLTQLIKSKSVDEAIKISAVENWRWSCLSLLGP